MSDKLFFKGRQDARQNHIKYGYQSKRSCKSGSKKHPLSLVVTNEARQKEVETLVAEAELFAEVIIDNSDGAVESIAELTVLLDTQATVKIEKLPGRNDLCLCGSGIKYKRFMC